MLASVIIIGFLAVGVAAYLLGGRRAEARTKETRRLRKVSTVQEQALDDIANAVDTYRDIDSVLATEVRAALRKARDKRREIEK